MKHIGTKIKMFLAHIIHGDRYGGDINGNRKTGLEEVDAMNFFAIIKKCVRWLGITLFWIFEITGLPRMPKNPPTAGKGGT